MNNILEVRKQFIVFKLDEQFYGINIQHVQIIERMKPIMRVPKVPHWVKGVINLRGEIIPVISLREQFNLPLRSHTDQTRMIIIKLEEDMVGLIVDEVKEVVEIAKEQIEVVQNIQGKIKIGHVVGVGKIEDNIITLLNLNNIIEDAFSNEIVR